MGGGPRSRFYRADGARPATSAAAAMLGGTSDKLDEVERMSSAFRDAMADGLYCLSDVPLYLCITDEAIAKHIGRDVPSLDARDLSPSPSPLTLTSHPHLTRNPFPKPSPSPSPSPPPHQVATCPP